MLPHMWVYGGSLDAETGTLTLEAEGPSYMDPSINARYRDVTQFVDADTRHNTSWVQGPDGEWIQMVEGTVKRVR